MEEKTVFESEADSFARNRLINIEQWKQIGSNKFPFEDNLLREIADQFKIHPSIILGRMCFEKDNYKIFTRIEKAIN